jgi:hypothetical protein
MYGTNQAVLSLATGICLTSMALGFTFVLPARHQRKASGKGNLLCTYPLGTTSGCGQPLNARPGSGRVFWAQAAGFKSPEPWSKGDTTARGYDGGDALLCGATGELPKASQPNPAVLRNGHQAGADPGGNLKGQVAAWQAVKR